MLCILVPDYPIDSIGYICIGFESSQSCPVEGGPAVGLFNDKSALAVFRFMT
jgi:hypothetical protein